MQKIIHTSLAYCQEHRIDAPCRFDIVAMQGDGTIEWIRNAFDATP